MKRDLKILILDDHSLYFRGIEVILKKEYPKSTIKSYSSILDMKEDLIIYSNYDIFISDIELPGENVFKLFSSIRKIDKLPILVVSTDKKISVIRKCKKLKIEGYILKNDDEFLIPAIKRVTKGESFYSPGVQNFHDKFFNDQIKISIREEEILKLVCKGFSNQLISEALNISVETVKTHKKNIKFKLSCRELNELIEIAKARFLL